MDVLIENEEGVENLVEITKEIVKAKIMSQTRTIKNRKSLHPTIVKNLITLRGFVSSKKNMQNFVKENEKEETEKLFLACYSVHEYP